jgi:hypothetical protein
MVIQFWSLDGAKIPVSGAVAGSTGSEAYGVRNLREREGAGIGKIDVIGTVHRHPIGRR